MRNMLLSVSLLLTNTYCLAQDAQIGTPHERKACSQDASRFCKRQLGDDKAVLQCLQQNRANLSRSCLKVFESYGK